MACRERDTDSLGVGEGILLGLQQKKKPQRTQSTQRREMCGASILPVHDHGLYRHDTFPTGETPVPLPPRRALAGVPLVKHGL